MGLLQRFEVRKKGICKQNLSIKWRSEDGEKFTRYLQHFSTKRLPPYTQALLKGVEIGVELRYSNIPLSEKIAIDLYPTKLPKTSFKRYQKF